MNIELRWKNSPAFFKIRRDCKNHHRHTPKSAMKLQVELSISRCLKKLTCSMRNVTRNCSLEDSRKAGDESWPVCFHAHFCTSGFAAMSSVD